MPEKFSLYTLLHSLSFEEPNELEDFNGTLQQLITSLSRIGILFSTGAENEFIRKDGFCVWKSIHSKHNKQQEVFAVIFITVKSPTCLSEIPPENSRFYRRELLGSFLKRFLPNHLDATFSFSFGGYINSNSGEEFVSMRHQPFNMSSPPPSPPATVHLDSTPRCVVPYSMLLTLQPYLACLHSNKMNLGESAGARLPLPPPVAPPR